MLQRSFSKISKKRFLQFAFARRDCSAQGAQHADAQFKVARFAGIKKGAQCLKRLFHKKPPVKSLYPALDFI